MSRLGRLAAHNTGDGWWLGVIDDNDEIIAEIEWPWDDDCVKTNWDLISYGYEIV